MTRKRPGAKKELTFWISICIAFSTALDLLASVTCDSARPCISKSTFVFFYGHQIFHIQFTGGSQVPLILEVGSLFRRREPWGGKWVSVGQRAINIWAPSLLESTRILATRHNRFTSHLNSEIPVAQTSQMTSNTFLVLPKYPFHCFLSIQSNILSIVNSFYCEAELRHQIVDTWHLSRHSFPLIGNNWYLISTLNILFFLTDRMQCQNHIKRTFEGRVLWKIKWSVFP